MCSGHKNPGQSICHLCGKALGDDRSREHVPPKQFFPKELRGDLQLLTVPTHPCCNRSYAKDEEYVFQSLSATAVRSPVGWALRRDRRRRFRSMGKPGLVLFEKVLAEFEQQPGGLYLPPGLVAKTFDRPRVHRVMWKIVRGLFFHHVGRFLPENTPHNCRLYGRRRDVPPHIQEMLDLALVIHGVEKSVFAYRFAKVQGEDMKAWWWEMLLWESVMVVVPFHDPTCNCGTCVKAGRKAEQAEGG